jgi:ABC-type uncharacterized transport system permease subunit
VGTEEAVTEELLAAAVRALSLGAPLLIAALGAIVNERAGVVNLGIEGMMALGALAAFAVAADGGSSALAIAAALAVGTVAALVHAVVTLTVVANSYVSGLALAMLGVGVAGLLGRRYEGFPLMEPVAEELFLGAAGLLAVGLWGFFQLTRPGLVLRSVGESPAAADALGVRVTAWRYGAVAFGGALAGLAGAFLSLSYRPAWTDGMTGGLGWIAVALVIFVGWHPLRAVLGSTFFGLLYYLQFRLQDRGSIPVEVFGAMPYLLVIATLAVSGRRMARGSVPASLGVPYRRGER